MTIWHSIKLIDWFLNRTLLFSDTLYYNTLLIQQGMTSRWHQDDIRWHLECWGFCMSKLYILLILVKITKMTYFSLYNQNVIIQTLYLQWGGEKTNSKLCCGKQRFYQTPPQYSILINSFGRQSVSSLYLNWWIDGLDELKELVILIHFYNIKTIQTIQTSHIL